MLYIAQMETHDKFVQAIREKLARENISVRQAALRAGLPVRSVQGILEGHVPSIERAAEVARALGICFHIGVLESKAGVPLPRGGAGSFHHFVPDIDLAVTGYARCSTMGHLHVQHDLPDLPMPCGLREGDGEAFYVVAKGASMIPEGIEDGDYCLISRNRPCVAGVRVWLKDGQGRACIKRLTGITDTTYQLRGWLDPHATTPHTPYSDEWMIANIVEKGVVLAVYRGKPDAEAPPALIADPKAPPECTPKRQAGRVANDPELVGLLTERIMAVHEETGVEITARRAAMLALQTHDRMINEVGGRGDRFVSAGEYIAALRQKLSA